MPRVLIEGDPRAEMMRSQGQGVTTLPPDTSVMDFMDLVGGVGMAAKRGGPRTVGRIGWHHLEPYLEKYMLDTPGLKQTAENMMKLANRARGIGPQNMKRRVEAIMEGMGFPTKLRHEYKFLKEGLSDVFPNLPDKAHAAKLTETKNALEFGKELYGNVVDELAGDF